MIKRTFAVVALSLCLIWCGNAAAGEPADQLKGSVDKIIDLLNDQSLSAPEKKLDRREKIFKVVEGRFDFADMAKRSLGEFWSQLSEAQQKEFQASFSKLLMNSYITKIEKYTDEKVNYSPERSKGDGFLVQTQIISGGRSIPVDYSLQKSDGRWVVYDVNIEGVSLVTNYRSQFREIVRKDGFPGLMNALGQKLKAVGL